jgi:hypothetical protein
MPSSNFKYVCDAHAGVLVLFWARVAVGLSLSAGAFYLFAYAFTLF